MSKSLFAVAAEAKPAIDFQKIDRHIVLRRMVVRHPQPKGTVLLLHGFPETIHAWDDVAATLAADYDVHAFDWPGYGLSSRPAADSFAYAPRDYARVLRDYIRVAGIDRSRLIIYATDIGALPALLAALDDPGIARRIIVGDFAPFDRPGLMSETLRNLKAPATAEPTRAFMSKNRDEIVENIFRRGLPEGAQFEVSPSFRGDMLLGWNHGEMTSADAFYHYYSHFTRDQDAFEANVAKLRTPLKIMWGEIDLYIDKAMAIELSNRTSAELTLLPGIGHYPHLQEPRRAIEEIRAAFH